MIFGVMVKFFQEKVLKTVNDETSIKMIDFLIKKAV